MRANSSGFPVGLGFALVSAFAFGTSGTLASGLIATGWSPLAIVWHRVLICSLATLVPALIALRGRWQLLRSSWRLIGAYGLMAIALTQLSHFSAVQYLAVAPALLIQYLAPLLIVGLLWLRSGERPTPQIVFGSTIAMGGMVLVLQVLGSGSALDWRGLVWAFIAMLGNAAFFIISAHTGGGLPPIALAAGGNLLALVILSLVSLGGALPWLTASEPVSYAGIDVAWWAPLLVLGLLSSALAYVTGITGARILGSRLSSFVGLTEVLFATTLAALLVGQLLTSGQLLGGLLVVAGVVLVKMGEGRLPAVRPVAVQRPAPDPVAGSPIRSE